MSDREELADLLRPVCASILEAVIAEACVSGDQARIPPPPDLRDVLDRGTEMALRAIALPADRRREELRTLIIASRQALDRLSVPAIARLGLSRIGLRYARAAVQRAARGRADGPALIREFAVFEGALAAAMQEAALVAAG